MNEQRHLRWSDLDVERYHDGELSAQMRAAMTAGLFTNEALRGRLDRVASVDELGRRALLGDVQPRTYAMTLSPTARRTILASAATLALVVTGSATKSMWMRSPEPPVVIAAPAPDPPVTPRTYSDERLALSIPVSAEFRFASLRHASSASAPKMSSEEQAIQSAIVQGDAEKALRLLARSEVKDRSAEWSKLGQMMQSAQRARAAILLLPINQQIEIVRAWSATPSLRPVVFERLEELLREPESAQAAVSLRGELAQNPQLSSWVESYAAR